MFVIKRKFLKSTKDLLKTFESKYNGFSTIIIAVDKDNNLTLKLNGFDEVYDVFPANVTEIIEAFSGCGKIFEFIQA